jgi:3-methylfumaryl-CoA hydratase
MWVGGRLSFHAPIPIGAMMERHSTIVDVAAKTGKSGTMVFVTIRHEIAVADRIAVREEQDLVYREMPVAGTGPAPGAEPKERTEAPRTSEWTRVIRPDPVQLFRFSALTFNAHRIHYDRDYCRDVEGYPGLVMHGPLLATLLMDHFLRRAPGARVGNFQFRAQRPLYDTAPFSLCTATTSAGADLWTLDDGGQMTMLASVDAV